MFNFFGNLNNMANLQPQPFNETYRCFPVACKNKSLEEGDKILLPSTALDHLARLKVSYPMMFEIQNRTTGVVTHCGVLEFSAEEGVAYIPYWMMQNLICESGGFVQIRNVTLPKGTFVQLQPHKTEFTELSNPRVVLERALRKFSCLTKGDTVLITHGEKKFYLDVVEVKPGNAVSIIETDMNVDFAPPKDLAEWEKKKAEEKKLLESTQESKIDRNAVGDFNLGDAATAQIATPEKSSSPSGYFAKLGSGNRLSSGKKSRTSPAVSPQVAPTHPTTPGGVGASRPTTPSVTTTPDGTKLTTVTQGKWDFVYSGEGKNKKLVKRVPHRKSSSPFTAFGGQGYSMKKS